MIPLEIQGAMIRVEKAQAAIEEYLESGARDKVVMAGLIEASTNAMRNLTEILNRWTDGSTQPVQ